MGVKVDFNMKGWGELKKTLQNERYYTRVGILGSDGEKTHNDTKLTNAEVGAIHELGLVAGIPKRSFLKMPLETKLFQKIASEKDNFYKALTNGKLVKWFQAVGLWSEEIINEAFATGGFGSWEPLSPKTIAAKSEKGYNATSGVILVESGQLRDSITSEVIDRSGK